MKRILYLFCTAFTFINASGKQVCFNSGMQINTAQKKATSFFVNDGTGGYSSNTLFKDTNAISGAMSAKGDVSFSFFYSYNRQGNYNSRYGNVSYANHLKLFGADWGGVVNYKRMINRHIFITLGIGYLDFEVDKIENETQNGGLTIKTHSRSINYPSTLLVLYQTTKYHYDNLCFHIGLEKQFVFLHTLPLFAGVDYLHAYRISRTYYIPFADRYYKTKNRGNFGDFINARFGISKRWGRFSLAPAFVLSVYSGWKQDIVLGEDPSKGVSNWFNGAGISMAVSYQIWH